MNEMILVQNEYPLCIVTINRPVALNALNEAVLVNLEKVIKEIDADKKIKVVILTGAGEKSFVAGADVEAMSTMDKNEIKAFADLGQRVMRSLEECRVPIIAMVNGYALGGGMELALACDLIVAADTAKFGQPEVNLGIIPGFGGTQRLIHRSGVGTARRLCYTAEILDANESMRLGIVDYVFNKNNLCEETKKIAKNISSKAPLAVESAKRAINKGIEEQLKSGLDEEVKEFLEVFVSEDRVLGMKAFLSKKK